MRRTIPALLALLGLACASQAGAATPMALQCGNVFDSKSARLVGEHTIVTGADGRIQSVLPGKTTAPGATAIDLSGQTCMPGWIDLHVHLGDESNPKAYEESFRLDDIDFGYRALAYADRTLKAGFTTVRDLGGDVTPHLRNAINQGYVQGPRIYAAGKAIATTGGHGDPRNGLNAELAHLMGPPGPTEGVINGVDDARQAVRQRYKDGSDLIKITATGGVLSYAKNGDAPQFTARGGESRRRDREGLRLQGGRPRARQGRHASCGRGRRHLDRARHVHGRRDHDADEEARHLVRADDHRRASSSRKKRKSRATTPRSSGRRRRASARQIQDTFAKAYKRRREDRLRHRPGRRAARREREASSVTWSRRACPPRRRSRPRPTTPREVLGCTRPGSAGPGLSRRRGRRARQTRSTTSRSPAR